MGRRLGKSPRDTQRRSAHLEERKRAMIVTEGSKTEPEYFRLLIRELGLTTASVTITGDGGSAPISVIEHAEGLLRDDPDFEYVFLVFDRDRHSTYDAAIAKARALNPRKAPKRQDVAVIPSIPSFEIKIFFPSLTNANPIQPARETDHQRKI